LKRLKQILLCPISFLYGIVVFVRNKCFDFKLLKSTSFKLPIISIGNLSVGGSGKTPHTEYLIRLLNQNTTTLSRGYKRKTKGYVLASETSTSFDIGDEPLQLYQKFKNIAVAVCEDRVEGVKKILESKPNPQAILLDDAFQHRAIKPGFNILITDFNNLFTNDYLMPSGRLREWRCGYKRADVIIVSKTPQNTPKNILTKISKDIHPTKRQNLYFSCVRYSNLTHFNQSKKIKIDTYSKKIDVLLFTGIANPTPLFSHIKKTYQSVDHLKFSDHHNFNKTDIEKIKNCYNKINSNNKIIITTEKDIMRLSLPEILESIQDLPIYYIPIEIDFISSDDKVSFDKQILDYVNSNTGN
jgi:tetraacyldisaccharide 4'-kinase